VPSTAFDHIAFALPRMADAVPFLVGVLGGVPHSGARGGPEFRFGTWRYANGGKLEVIEPLGDDGFVHRFLASRGPGIHHVTFKVPSLDEACERARVRGCEIVGDDDSYDDWKTAFLHPKQALGIVVQFAQTSGASDPTRWTPPATIDTIDVDPTGGEGPVAIELTTKRPLELPDGPVPVRGTTFRLARP
jgi:catechol 2,3-dioxygenase-like lactoylglutathione lyase family enzyme